MALLPVVQPVVKPAACRTSSVRRIEDRLSGSPLHHSQVRTLVQAHRIGVPAANPGGGEPAPKDLGPRRASPDSGRQSAGFPAQLALLSGQILVVKHLGRSRTEVWRHRSKSAAARASRRKSS